jgi:hypothetical protein
MWQQEFIWFFTIFHQEFRKNNPIAFEVLMVLAVAHWARSHFPGRPVRGEIWLS